jgi:hypothetical protein
MTGNFRLLELFPRHDGRVQGCASHRLRKKCDDARGFTAFPYCFVRVCGNDDGRNVDTRAGQIFMEIQASHLRHLEVDNQTFRPSVGQRRQKFMRSIKCSRLKRTNAQQPGQGSQNRRIVVHNSDPTVRFSHEDTYGDSGVSNL